ncbi:hypothetical protein HK104_010473 [Borealophlyctis nickersoniae]|nr:hypothetical protein HK104_010473 [Borealophlyctis nickersoniae]
MAKAAARKTFEKNVKTLTDLRKYHLLAVLLHVTFRVVFRWGSFTLWDAVLFVIANVFAIALYSQLHSFAAPSFATSGALEDAGVDLDGPGMVAYMFDIIYITWFALAATCISRVFWWTYAGAVLDVEAGLLAWANCNALTTQLLDPAIPLYAGYKAWTKLIQPFVFGRSSTPQQPLQAGGAKKQKVKIMRG